MPTRRHFLERYAAAMLLLAVPFAAAAQAQSPQAFVEALYQPYRNKGFKGQPYWEPSLFFTPDLASAIDRDMTTAKQRGEPPLLDGDPFVDAQEWDIADLTIAASTHDDTSLATVAFKNFGERKTVTLSLVRTAQGWRISNIVSADTSLRALYKLP